MEMPHLVTILVIFLLSFISLVQLGQSAQPETALVIEGKGRLCQEICYVDQYEILTTTTTTYNSYTTTYQLPQPLPTLALQRRLLTKLTSGTELAKSNSSSEFVIYTFLPRWLP